MLMYNLGYLVKEGAILTGIASFLTKIYRLELILFKISRMSQARRSRPRAVSGFQPRTNLIATPSGERGAS